ncbi:MAG: hypothetical protein M0P00_09900 [Bacteroidaceae bacterium]|nr:hypothetical protein [Bacteroidaceae bacterium]
MKDFQSPQQRKMYNFLLLLIIAATMGLQGWRTLFNNFAVDQVGINGFQVGVIQSFREIPGFLTFLVVYLLLIFKEHKLSIYSVMLTGLGVMLTGFFPTYLGIIFTTFLFSTGFHYFETTNKSLTLQYFSSQQSPIILGKQQSWKAITNIGVGILILITSRFLNLKWNFVLLGTAVIILSIIALFLSSVDRSLPIQKSHIVVKKKYWLFYALNLLSGARRQVFVVFAIFMLVEKYHFSVMMITLLFIFNNIIIYFTAPYIGKGINRYGERTVLTLEYSFMIIVFLGYSFVQNAWIIAALYIVDNLFFSCSISINTFFQKIGDKTDIAPSMAAGFAINHIAAVFIPVIGGLLWIIDYQIPFLIGVFLAIVSLFLVQLIPNAIRKANN